ncbi:MAG: hypothetical protein IPG25_01335 [Proteobacteria bacterium]|nr:hypothetical protein [Pseudomonadota bacterium]
MSVVRAVPLPDHALLAEYRRAGAFTDCYCTELAADVGLPQYVEAFYTTWLFKLERWIIGWAVHLPSTDREAAELGMASAAKFAAWTVEARTESQLLLCDVQQRTRSWLMLEHAGRPDGTTTLYFGSAIVPMVDSRTGERRLSGGFRALLGFHKLYSRALLATARTRLQA